MTRVNTGYTGKVCHRVPLETRHPRARGVTGMGQYTRGDGEGTGQTDQWKYRSTSRNRSIDIPPMYSRCYSESLNGDSSLKFQSHSRITPLSLSTINSIRSGWTHVRRLTTDPGPRTRPKTYPERCTTDPKNPVEESKRIVVIEMANVPLFARGRSRATNPPTHTELSRKSRHDPCSIRESFYFNHNDRSDVRDSYRSGILWTVNRELLTYVRT